MLENGYQLDPDLPTFMQVLQQGGWRTGAFGKAHFQPHFRGLWPDYMLEAYTPKQLEFGSGGPPSAE